MTLIEWFKLQIWTGGNTINVIPKISIYSSRIEFERLDDYAHIPMEPTVQYEPIDNLLDKLFE